LCWRSSAVALFLLLLLLLLPTPWLSNKDNVKLTSKLRHTSG
jgi:hypothetical protein